jgi:hypothetical protein
MTSVFGEFCTGICKKKKKQFDRRYGPLLLFTADFVFIKGLTVDRSEHLWLACKSCSAPSLECACRCAAEAKSFASNAAAPCPNARPGAR